MSDEIPDSLLVIFAVVAIGVLILAMSMPVGYGSPPLWGFR